MMSLKTIVTFRSSFYWDGIINIKLFIRTTYKYATIADDILPWQPWTIIPSRSNFGLWQLINTTFSVIYNIKFTKSFNNSEGCDSF